jgi:hypothetical protein
VRLTGTALAALLALVASVPGSRAAAQLPGIRLLVTPPSLSFNNVTAKQPVTPAQCELVVRVLVQGRRPWRLTVVAFGNLQSGEGDQIPIQAVSWQGSPAAVFASGTLTPGQPVLVGQGQGSRDGVLRFVLKNRWEYAAGQYGVKLLFRCTSP